MYNMVIYKPYLYNIYNDTGDMRQETDDTEVEYIHLDGNTDMETHI